MGGRFIVGIGAANRAACGISAGDAVEADLRLDAQPREVVEPPDFAQALDADPAARAAFDRLAYTHRRRHVLTIERAKTPETRRRRIEKAINEIRGRGS